MPDERSRLKVVQALSEKLGPEVAAALMECVPPFPWTDIVTKRDLVELEARMSLRFQIVETKFGALETKLDGRLDALEGKLDGRLDALETKLDGRLEGFEGKLDGRLEGFEGKFEGLEGRLTALIQDKLSAQNRGLLLVASAAIIGSVVANILG
jgi:hypothetical protein